ncbi:hypothetical protein [Hydrogenophaga sp. IBVHS2]|uniref:hypothetical protein n=1 Tax=Hydrogenophaga sp. IBVHS2 TaxID=1985170 RepID=UPI000A2D4E8F|nr:hypothetical protein [Hydrogenophaga sp. IBVHS2]OSZ63426.1 hypothetical protein CAP38_13135 [Hydrogenophaga sp. IBVHS2]
MPFPVSLATALMAALLMALSLSATAAEKEAPKKKPSRVTFVKSGSGETASERERRLIRECRGRPDAGACLGYAR